MSEEEVSATIHNLDQPNVAAWIAALAVMQLRKMGSVTFFVDEEGYIQLANPLGVFLDAEKIQAPKGRFRFVRPILAQAKPQFVAHREDGSLWEVEFQDEDTPERQ